MSAPRHPHRPHAGGGNGQGAEVFLGLIVALMLLTGGLVTITGALAGVLAGNGPIVVPLADTPSVLTALPSHLSDPAMAWPATVRNDLPGRTALLFSLAAAIAVVIGLLVAALWAVGKVRGAGGGEGARFARRGELGDLHVREPRVGRVTLGRHLGRLIAAEPRASVAIFAPSQSGKTTGLVVPALLEWNGPVLATSVKADLTHDTLTARQHMGEVRVFDPTGSSGLPSASWSPVAAAGTWEAARRTAAALLQVGEGSARGADEAFWRPAAARLLAPLLLAAHQQDGSMGEVLRWIARGEQDEPRELLTDADMEGVEAADVALDDLESIWGMDDRTRSSLVQTAATALDAWREPTVAAATTGSGPLAVTADWLLSGSNTLYITAPASDQRRLCGLFTALIGTVVTEAFRRSSATGKPIDPALLLCLDECANVAPLPNLDEIASTGPGQGVQLLSVFQNLSQVSDRFGREKGETILANHRARLFGSGIADRATLDYLGAVLGEEDVARISTTRQSRELHGGSRTVSQERRRLASPDRVRQAEQDTALLIYGRLRPAWIHLRPWYKDRALRRLVEQPPAPAALEPATVEATS